MSHWPHTLESYLCVCVCVCVCGQKRELLMPPAPRVRIGAPDRNMDKRLWDSSLRVDNKAEQSIDFNRRKWEAAITAKVRAVDKCLRVFVCMCVRMCSVSKPGEIINRFVKDRYYHRRRIAIRMSQDCMISLLSGCARGSVTHPCIDAFSHRDTQIDTGTRTPTCIDSFAVAALGSFSHASCQHVTEFL